MSTHAMGQEVHEGWLLKSPPSWQFWHQEWRRKYFVLCSGNMPGECYLMQYSDDAKVKLQRKINLQDCVQADAYLTYESKNHKIKYDWIFDLRMSNNHKKSYTIYLVAKTKADMLGWVDLICRVCNFERENEEQDDHDNPDHEMDNGEPSSLNFSDPLRDRANSLDSASDNFAATASQGANLANSQSLSLSIPVPAPATAGSKATVNVGGGAVNLRQKQGYIALKDCISGPPRPTRPAPAGTANGFGGEQRYSDPALLNPDDPPVEAPPPIPAPPARSGSSDSFAKPVTYNHSRDPSNDSTSSANRVSSDSEAGGSLAPSRNNGYHGSTADDTSGDDRISPVRPSLNAVVPPRPPKPKSRGVAKPPELHTPYKNSFVVTEDDPPSTYDRPPPTAVRQPPPRPLYDSLPRSNGADHCGSLPRHRSNTDEGNADINGQQLSLNVSVSKSTLNDSSDTGGYPSADCSTVGQFSFDGPILSPPPRRQSSGHSPNPNAEVADKPPVDRSLKPTAKVRHRSSESSTTSPIMINAPVQIQEQQPHIPPRLPPEKKRLASASGSGPDPLYDQPRVPGILGVARKESFARKRENRPPAIGAQNRTPAAIGPAKRHLEVNPQPKTMDYVDIDSSGGTPLLGGSRHPSVSCSTADGSAPPADNGTVSSSSATISPSAAAAAKLAYVTIHPEATKALEKTKMDQERMYRTGTLDRKQ